MIGLAAEHGGLARPADALLAREGNVEARVDQGAQDRGRRLDSEAAGAAHDLESGLIITGGDRGGGRAEALDAQALAVVQDRGYAVEQRLGAAAVDEGVCWRGVRCRR